MNDSRLSGLYKLSVPERIAELQRRGCLSQNDARALTMGRQVLSLAAADTMIENVVGVFGLPLGIAPNFVVNSREYIVPLVVEEPSVVAALSNAASMARDLGGFSATCEESLLTGQIHINGVQNVEATIAALMEASEELLERANAVHPRLSERGGGVRDIEFRELRLTDGADLVVVHILVDTCDAMGANLVNTICESIAPAVAAKCGGNVALRILSNLADRSLVTASARIATSALGSDGMEGEKVRDSIVVASDIANVDPYRAATHNKGVMNGIDALAIATGNDWRAIEAGVHAYAARAGRYSAITAWSADADGHLFGEIEIPLKLGTVGGTLASNDAARLGLAMTGVKSAKELSGLMAAVGLAQNFSAIRALATSGIQKGHMRMHARSVAASIGTRKAKLAEVTARLVESGEIKDWKAVEILNELEDRTDDQPSDAVVAESAGKVILLGEHAVVYGRSALAVPIPKAVRATVSLSDDTTVLNVPDWGLRTTLSEDCHDGAAAAIRLIVQSLNVAETNFYINVSSSLPRGMGLGSSAAIAVAITRAVAKCMQIELSNAAVNDIAFECEKLAHGTPSGIDNTMSCYAEPMLFRNTGALGTQVVQVNAAIPIVVGFSSESGMTHDQVAGVRYRREENTQHYEAIFDQIDNLSMAGAEALANGQYSELGQMMNICHGMLNAIGVSTPDLENMVSVARENGALGAKLTGAGGGGSMVALCPGCEDQVRSALRRAGYSTLSTEVR